jgi:membrane protease YdiL (CAAX protease family)
VAGDQDEPAGRAEGWYPDPFGAGRTRWWDGAAWSGYTGIGREVVWDPPPSADGEPPPGLPGLGVALLGTAVGLALGFVVSAVMSSGDEPGGRAAEIGLSALALWAGLVGACVYVSRRRGTGSLVRDFGFRFTWSDLGLGLAGALVGRLVAVLILLPIPFPSQRLDDVDEAVLQEGTSGAWAWVVIIAVTCIGAPLVEELYFRGLLQTRLVGRFGVATGIGVTSLVFGSAHLVAWQGPITLAYGWSIAGAGLVLGILRHVSGRLGTAIMAHAFFNVVAMIALAAVG